MRIGIVNDTPMAAEGLRRMVAALGDHEVAWIAYDGEQAVTRAGDDRPDLILMDLIMPVMDGIEATRRIMAASPCPILVVTASMASNAGKVFEAMGAGALDAINTPVMDTEYAPEELAALLHKIEVVGRLGVQGSGPATNPAPVASRRVDTRLPYLLAMGASSGGPQAIATVLKGLPADIAAAVVIVQHVDAQFAPRLAEWLNAQVALPVRAAREGDELEEGTVYLAATADHLVMRPGLTLGYSSVPDTLAYRPSIDVFFETVAGLWPGAACGVLLTGMGRDGAAGLRLLREKGAYTIAQDAHTSSVYGMPKAARELDAVVDTLPVDHIAGAVLADITKTKSQVLEVKGEP